MIWDSRRVDARHRAGHHRQDMKPASRGRDGAPSLCGRSSCSVRRRSITSRDNMARTAVKKIETSTSLLEAAKKVLRHAGYAGLSTREVAAEAGVPLSQIHYHFGSKQNLVLQLFEYLNAQLLDRQNRLFGDPSLKLSEQWDRACDYLDQDIASGYVRVLQELIAVSWHDAEGAKVIRAGIMGWVDLITGLARAAEAKIGPLGPFSAEDFVAMPASSFIGVGSLFLLGLLQKGSPIRASLRRVGDLIRTAEGSSSDKR